MNGLHLVADVSGCCASRLLVDETALLAACLNAVKTSGLHVVGELAVRFPVDEAGTGGGVTATVLLAESHLCVHTWPEIDSVTLDVYVCNRTTDHSAKAQALMDQLIALFEPVAVRLQRVVRASVGQSAQHGL